AGEELVIGIALRVGGGSHAEFAVSLSANPDAMRVDGREARASGYFVVGARRTGRAVEQVAGVVEARPYVIHVQIGEGFADRTGILCGFGSRHRAGVAGLAVAVLVFVWTGIGNPGGESNDGYEEPLTQRFNRSYV